MPQPPTVAPLHPVLDIDLNYPHCDVALDVVGWCVPGMRVLAEL